MRLAALIFLILPPLLGTEAKAAGVSSQVLRQFKVSSSGGRYLFQASATEGTFGHFSDVLAAKNAIVELTDRNGGDGRLFPCRGFSFHLHDRFAVCEQEKKTFIFDLKASKISEYGTR